MDEQPKFCALIEKERKALRALTQISSQDDNVHSNLWDDKKQNIKKSSKMRKQRMSIQFQSTRAEKLPLIPNKHNLSQNQQTFVNSAKKANSYILFEKGLRSFGTVNIKRMKGTGRYIDQNSKFVKMYSQTNEQQIQLIKQWLHQKKQNCKAYNSIATKKKGKPPMEQPNVCLSIKNIL